MSRTRSTILVSLAVLASSGAAAASRTVINEIRKLRDSLPVADGQRGELNLRLADLLSNECLVSSSGTEASRAKDCQEAFGLYRDAQAKAPSSLKSRILFQMARISLERGDFAQAKPLLVQVLSEADSVELKRESAFRLAEIEEADPATLKSAEARYQAALALCNGGDACSYAQYRIAWIRKRQGDLPRAIEGMKLALFDAKGQPRSEAVRDLVAFLGEDSRDAATHIDYVEKLSAKLGQPKMLEDLAFAYLSGANKAAGVKVLEVVNARQPTVAREMKLLEEIQGVRDDEKFADHLASLDRLSKDSAQVAAMGDARADLEKAAKRIAVQLDGDRKTRPQRTEDFKNFSLVTIELFPASPDVARVMEGWVAAETDANVQLAKLKEWTTNPRHNLKPADKIALHELRAGLAQKAKNSDVVIEEMQALLATNPAPAKALEYRYALARAAYEKKDYARALPAFQAIASEAVAKGGEIDKLAIQSQHLALEILNQQKDLAGLEKQAALWTSNASIRANAKLADDLKEMAEASDQAEFEGAVALQSTPEALSKFRAFCEKGRFLPKSCDNAKTLAIQLGRHADLVAVLVAIESRDTTGNAVEELAAEYEAGAYFLESAKLQERTLAKNPALAATILPWIKTALAYELGGDLASRDRILVGLPKHLAKMKTPSEGEQLALASALQDARLLTPAWLKTPGFSAAFRARVSEGLESTGQGNADSRKAVLASNVATGPLWHTLVVSEALRLEEKQAGIRFHGKNGERLFQNRIAALKQMNDFIGRVLPGSSTENRIKLLRISKAGSEGLAKEILESPLPASLKEEEKNAVLASLAELAKPFQDNAEATTKLLNDELAKTTDPAERSRLDQLATSELARLVADEKAASAKTTASVTQVAASTAAPSIARLRQNPKDAGALESLRDLYRQSSQERLALYFEGRLLQVKKELSTP
jgi:hypothetical protein